MLLCGSRGHYSKNFLPMMVMDLPIMKSCGVYQDFISSSDSSIVMVGKVAERGKQNIIKWA